MEHTVDLLVIGPGTAGCLLALSCRKAGRQVTVAGTFSATMQGRDQRLCPRHQVRAEHP